MATKPHPNSAAARLADANEALANFRRQASEQIRQIAALEASNKKLEETITAERARAVVADKDRQEAEGALASTRRQLHAAELEAARLRGYIERVCEDDAAREGPVELSEVRHIPRRPPPLGRSVNDTCATDNSSRRWGR